MTVLRGLSDLRVGGTDVYDLDLCGACETGRLNPLPSDRQLDAAYPKDYFWYKDPGRTGDSERRRVVERVLDLLNWKGGYSSVWEPPASASSILDIGCGTGDYLRAVRRAGLKVTGVEPNAFAASVARASGIPIVEAPVETALEGMDELFDVIVLNHVLEHVRDPIGLLTQCRIRLNPSGCLQIAVPSFAALGVKLFGRNWLPLDAPRHLYHWSPTALARLLPRAGFRIQGISCQFNPFTYGQSAAVGRWAIGTTSMVGRSWPIVASISLFFAACAPWTLLWGDRLSPYIRVLASPVSAPHSGPAAPF